MKYYVESHRNQGGDYDVTWSSWRTREWLKAGFASWIRSVIFHNRCYYAVQIHAIQSWRLSNANGSPHNIFATVIKIIDAEFRAMSPSHYAVYYGILSFVLRSSQTYGHISLHCIAMNDRTLNKWVINYACLCVYYYYEITMRIVISCYHMKTVVINQGQIYRLNINITYIVYSLKEQRLQTYWIVFTVS